MRVDENEEEIQGQEVAIKIYEKKKLSTVTREAIKREIESLR